MLYFVIGAACTIFGSRRAEEINFILYDMSGHDAPAGDSYGSISVCGGEANPAGNERRGGRQMSRKDFEALLLKNVGPQSFSTSICGALFEEVDGDSNGWIDSQELLDFLGRMKSGESGSRISYFYFVFDRLKQASIRGCLLFFSGSSISIANNLLGRSVKTNILTRVLVSSLIMWMFVIGSLCFIWSALKSWDLGHGDKTVAKLLRYAWHNINSLDQGANFLWLIGSVFYVVAVRGTVSDDAQLALFIAGGVCYFVGGVLSFVSLYKAANTRVLHRREILNKLATFVDGINARNTAHVKTVTFAPGTITIEQSNKSTLHRRQCSAPAAAALIVPPGDDLFFINKHIHKDDFFLQKDLPSKSIPRHRRLSSAPIPPVWVVEIKQGIDLTRPAVQESVAVKLLDSSQDVQVKQNEQLYSVPTMKREVSTTCPSVQSEEVVAYCQLDSNIKKASRRASSETARTEQSDDSDCDEGQDNCLECSEVYLSLDVDDLGTFLEVWNDVSFAKKMACHEEVRRYSDRSCRLSSRTSSPLAGHLDVCVYLLAKPSFYVAIMSVIAGAFFTIGTLPNIGLSDRTASNLFLLGSIQYLCGSSYSLYQTRKNLNSDWALMQYCRMVLVQQIVDGNEDDLEMANGGSI